MEASNGSAFLPFLAVLELLGLKIYWFLICVEEMVVATKVGLPQLALDLVSKALMVGLMVNRSQYFQRRRIAWLTNPYTTRMSSL